jgi:hypothetical protein
VTNYGKYCNKTMTLPAGVTQPPTVAFVPGTQTVQTLLAGSLFSWNIPAGALGSTTTLIPTVVDQNTFSTSAQPSLGAKAGYFLQLRPKGTVFLVPITVVFAVDASVVVPAGYTIKVFKLDDTTGLWVEMPGSTYDPVTGAVSVSLSSFSIYGSFVVENPAAALSSGSSSQGSNKSVLIAIVLAVVFGLLIVIGSLWSVAYFKNQAKRNAGPQPQQGVYNAATTAV